MNDWLPCALCRQIRTAPPHTLLCTCNSLQHSVTTPDPGLQSSRIIWIRFRAYVLAVSGCLAIQCGPAHGN